jgi:hypothetical protein
MDSDHLAAGNLFVLEENPKLFFPRFVRTSENTEAISFFNRMLRIIHSNSPITK